MTVGGAARLATVLATECGIESPSDIDLEAIAFHKGALVEPRNLQGCAARLVRRGTLSLIAVREDIADTPHGRFCIAHELGHLCVHRNRTQLAMACTHAMILAYNALPEEREASAFAAELLMPKRLFAPECNRSMATRETIERLAATFQCSLTSTALRYAEVGPCLSAVVVSREGAVKWCRPGTDFPFWLPSRGDALDRSTLAARGESGSSLVASAAWLGRSRGGDSGELLETTILMPRIGETLTVLSVPPNSRLDQLAAR